MDGEMGERRKRYLKLREKQEQLIRLVRGNRSEFDRLHNIEWQAYALHHDTSETEVPTPLALAALRKAKRFQAELDIVESELERVKNDLLVGFE